MCNDSSKKLSEKTMELNVVLSWSSIEEIK